MSYTLEFTGHAARQLKSLDRSVKGEIKTALKKLARDPYAPDLNVKKLSGRDGEYRLRVRDYRIVYTLASSVMTVTVIDVDHRRNIYR